MSDWYGSDGSLGLYGAIDSYGTLNPTVQSPVAVVVEPFTVDEICTYLRVSPDETPARTNELAGFITAARIQAEIAQNRDLVTKFWDLTFDYWMAYRIQLRAPLVSVSLVQYTDWTETTFTLNPGTDYTVDTSKQPGTISPPYNKTWPTFTSQASSAVLIRFTSGYANTDPFWAGGDGAMIKMGMKKLIADWDSNRLSFEMGSGSMAEYPYAVTTLLSQGSIVRAR